MFYTPSPLEVSYQAVSASAPSVMQRSTLYGSEEIGSYFIVGLLSHKWNPFYSPSPKSSDGH